MLHRSPSGTWSARLQPSRARNASARREVLAGRSWRQMAAANQTDHLADGQAREPDAQRDAAQDEEQDEEQIGRASCRERVYVLV